MDGQANRITNNRSAFVLAKPLLPIQNQAMSKYHGEKVLVVTRALFDQLGAFQGLKSDPGAYLPALLDPANNFFLDREAAEDDPGHKQLIPYCIFCCDGKILRYVRGGSSGEKRLASQSSIGIGGHINASDFTSDHLGQETYDNGVSREIAEELKIGGSFTHRIAALLNDDTNEVGKVHLGVVHIVELENEDVEPNEAAIESLEFVTLETLAADDTLETWSRICADALRELLG